MLRLFRNYNPYSTILLFILAFVVKLGFFVEAPMPVSGEQQVVWNYIITHLENVFGNNGFIYTFIAVLFIVFQGVFLNYIANKNHIYPSTTNLPAYTYILITSLQNDWNHLSAPLFNNWLILSILHLIVSLYAHNSPRKILFNIGCLISLSSMLIFPNIIFLLFLTLALLILRPFKIAEWMVTLLGLLTPIYILAGFLFLFDKLQVLPRIIVYDFLDFNKIPTKETIAFSTISGLIFIGIIMLNKQMNRMLFQIKKIWWVLIVFFFAGIISSIFTFAFNYNQWIVTLLPASLFITHIWFIERPKMLAGAISWATVAIVIYLEWFFK